MTLLESAKKGERRKEFEAVAEYEKIPVEEVIRKVAEGKVVIPKNVRRDFEIIRGIGEGLKVKVNANIGGSPVRISVEEELEKMRAAVRAGTDSVMDLSIGRNITVVRKAILSECPVMVGTVPIYEVAFRMSASRRYIDEMSLDDFLKVVEKQAQEGVDFMTIHAGVTRQSVARMEKMGRELDVVSRGGSMLVYWMRKNGKENPLYEGYDEILAILKEYDVTISIGDGMRPGALVDATDAPQIDELLTIGELVERARDAGVQAMVEGPGHIPLHQIEANVRLEKSVCRGAPFYVLGPVVVDTFPGYDHIVSAIGGALAAYYGADFLCYVTPAEHLSLPTVEDVVEGVIAAKIAAVAADLAKGNREYWEWQREMARARKSLDWEKQISLAHTADKARLYRERSGVKEEYCSMCGEFCAIKTILESEGGD